MITNHDFSDAPLFELDSTDKQVVITIKDKPDVITNTELYEDGIKLEESLCSEAQLRFGSCEAAQITFKISTTAVAYSLEGRTIYVKMYLDGHTNNKLNIGTYKVATDSKNANTDERTIVAYDVMKEILDADVSDWYEALLPNDNSTTTISAMRSSFFSHFGVTQEAASLVNDAMPVKKTWTTPLTGQTVITAICEANGVFGHINRNGNFVYLDIYQNTIPLYPSDDLYPSDTLYPSDGFNRVLSGEGEDGGYTSGEFENYSVEKITQLEILAETGDVGQTIGADDSNIYTVVDNALFFGMSAADLTTYGTNLFNAIKNVTYIPYELEAIGSPCYEVGDGLICQTYNGIIKSFILHRLLVGAQSLIDTYRASGEATYTRDLGNIRSQVEMLKNRGNILKRDVDQTMSEIYDENHVSRITQNANSISAEITNRQNADSALGIRIDGVAEQLSLYVKFDQEYSGIVISKNKVHIKSTGTFQVDAGNFRIDENGDVLCKGEIQADSGYIGNLLINNGWLYYKPNNTEYPVVRFNDLQQALVFGSNSFDVQLTGFDLSIWCGNNIIDLGNSLSGDLRLQVQNDDLVLKVAGSGSIVVNDGTEENEVAWRQLQDLSPQSYILAAKVL